MISAKNSLRKEIMVHKILRDMIMNSKNEKMDAIFSTILSSKADQQVNICPKLRDNNTRNNGFSGGKPSKSHTLKNR